MEMLKSPHLPNKKVTSVLCGNNDFFIKAAREIGLDIQIIPDDKRLPAPIRNHADIQCFHLEEGKILTTNPDLLMNKGEYSIEMIKETPSDSYPNDCLLNCFILNNVLVAGKTCSKSLLEHAEKNSIEIKYVNQGYAKCSTAIIQNDAIITADYSIAKALESCCNILVIDQGHIRLDGYNYGFIGGTCGKLSSDSLAFLGNPNRHPNGKRIVSFAENNNCSVESLRNGELNDFGGFIPLFEEK